MTNPMPPGSGEPVPPPDPIPAYQPPPSYQPPQPDNPYAAPQQGYYPQNYYQGDPYGAAQGYGAVQPYSGPAYSGPAGYGYPPNSGQPPSYPYDYGYGSPYSRPGYQASRPHDGLAIASLVVSCVSILGLCTWGIGALLGVLGAIFGHVARRRIRTSGANGSGMALAGIIIGWTIAAIGVLIATILVVAIVTSESSSTP